MKKKKPMINFVKAGTGTMFSSMLLAGLLIGYMFDRWLDVAPICMISFGLLGFIGGLKKVSDLVNEEPTQSGKDDVNNKGK